ncbi:MAG: glycosyltransferase [Deltaproteobacteria bacterium]|nr:glycosyltransferase [Deltaproteobacteria bacterium]
MTSNNSETLLIAVAPFLFDEAGHDFAYHKSVEKAADHLGLGYRVWLPLSCNIDNLPRHWEKILPPEKLDDNSPYLKKIYLRIKRAFSFGLLCLPYFKRMKKMESTIIFLESFSSSILFILTLILFLTARKKGLSLWLLYRYEPAQLRLHGLPYKYLNQILKKILSPEKIRLLTDSHLLAHSLSAYFNEKVAVVPIPHVHPELPSFSKQGPLVGVTCWWPGRPRTSKGLEIIQAISKIDGPKALNIKLVAAHNSFLSGSPDGIKIELIKDTLTEKEYLYWLNVSDVILLPYDPKTYSQGTSGIFVEAISAGKPTLVSNGTWMASELTKHDLGELIMNWYDNFAGGEIISRIIQVAESSFIRDKILAMQKVYQKNHGEEAFARAITQLAEKGVYEQ